MVQSTHGSLVRDPTPTLRGWKQRGRLVSLDTNEVVRDPTPTLRGWKHDVVFVESLLLETLRVRDPTPTLRGWKLRQGQPDHIRRGDLRPRPHPDTQGMETAYPGSRGEPGERDRHPAP